MCDGNRFRSDVLAATILVSALAMTSSLALAGPTYSPDLVVTLQVRPAHPLVGETVTIVAEVENRAAAPAGATVLVLRVEGTAEPREFTVGGLDARETLRFEHEVAFPIPGHFKVIAEADAREHVAESDESNNTTVTSILVRTGLSVDRAAP